MRITIAEVQQTRPVVRRESTATTATTEFHRTAYIRSENEEVLTYECFYELMKHIDSSKTKNQIDILFQILDADRNDVLSKQ